jgi:ADP-ribose pyrophosphatase YjhB (NUDIX family)
MPPAPGLLARGPWRPNQVAARWRDEEFVPGEEAAAAADAAIAELRDRGSPSHDGLSARLADYDTEDGRLELELQPMRWSLRLGEDASQALASLCVTRAADGRWLAGRRAPWVASWAGRWALGAGGAVEVGENPADTLARELHEEWSVAPDRLSAEALVRIPSGQILFVGVAWLPAGAEVTPDHEHDAFAWWPAEVERWPDEADAPLRAMAALLAAA